MLKIKTLPFARSLMWPAKSIANLFSELTMTQKILSNATITDSKEKAKLWLKKNWNIQFVLKAISQKLALHSDLIILVTSLNQL